MLIISKIGETSLKSYLSYPPDELSHSEKIEWLLVRFGDCIGKELMATAINILLSNEKEWETKLPFKFTLLIEKVINVKEIS